MYSDDIVSPDNEDNKQPIIPENCNAFSSNDKSDNLILLGPKNNFLIRSKAIDSCQPNTDEPRINPLIVETRNEDIALDVKTLQFLLIFAQRDTMHMHKY